MDRYVQSIVICIALTFMAGACGGDDDPAKNSNANSQQSSANATTSDGCENGDATADADGDGVCDADDICVDGDDSVDLDEDGVPDACDACPADVNDDSDGDGVCDSDDSCEGSDDSVDTDGDGVADGCDSCPADANDDSDGDGVCDSDDVCADGDDNVDTDGDGVADGCDTCPDDANDDSDGDGVCDSDDVCEGGDDTADADTDGTPDQCDVCVGADINVNNNDVCDRDEWLFFSDGSWTFYENNNPGYPATPSPIEVTLTPLGAGGVAGVALDQTERPVPFDVYFDYKIFDEDGCDMPSCRFNTADGLVMMFAKDLDPYESTVPPTGGARGFIADGTGYGVNFAVYDSRAILLTDPVGSVSDFAPYQTYTGEEWRTVHVRVEATGVTVWVEGIELISYSGNIDDTHAGFGFGAATGGADGEHSIRRLIIE